MNRRLNTKPCTMQSVACRVPNRRRCTRLHRCTARARVLRHGASPWGLGGLHGRYGVVCAWGRRSSCCHSALGSIGVWSQSPRDATTRRHVIGSPLAFGAPRGGHARARVTFATIIDLVAGTRARVTIAATCPRARTREHKRNVHSNAFCATKASLAEISTHPLRMRRDPRSLFHICSLPCEGAAGSPQCTLRATSVQLPRWLALYRSSGWP